MIQLTDVEYHDLDILGTNGRLLSETLSNSENDLFDQLVSASASAPYVQRIMSWNSRDSSENRSSHVAISPTTIPQINSDEQVQGRRRTPWGRGRKQVATGESNTNHDLDNEISDWIEVEAWILDF